MGNSGKSNSYDGVNKTCWENYHRRDNRIKDFLKDIRVDSVLDLGAGNQNLESFFVSQDILYYPVDIAPRFCNTIVADFNKGEFPDIVADLSLVLGVMEYLDDVAGFIRAITKHTARYVVFSYWDIDERPNPSNWTTYLKVSEIEEMFGWVKIKEQKWNKQTLVLLENIDEFKVEENDN